MAALAMLSSPYKIGRLTPRESEIAVYAALGYKNREIGQKAGIDDQTVKNHMSKIFLKLGIKKREELEPIVWNEVPQLREEMVKVGRAPQNTSASSPAQSAASISRPSVAGRGAEDVVTPEVRS